ncbi:MAG: elongation factor G [Faecalibacillus sp.]
MRVYHANELGNVAVLGHSGSGKTSVIEAMAKRAGIIDKLGSIQSGNTLSDYDDEEIKRQASVNMSVIPLEWDNCKVNLLDTPGNFDFVGEVEAALYAAESAVIVVPSYKDISIGTKQAMFRAKDKAKIIYINGLDNPDADYKEKLEQLKKTYGKAIAPIQVPIMENNKMVGYINVAKMEGRIFKGEYTEPFPIPEEMMDEVMPIKEMIDEAVANTNDELLEKYLNEEPFTKEEISLALREGVTSLKLIPVLCGTSNIGIQILLNSIVAFFSAAGDMCNSMVVENIDSKEEDIIGFDESLPPSLFIFKTIANPFVGRESLFKVCTGTIKTGMSLLNVNKNEVEKVQKLYIKRGKELIEVDELCAGDIGCMTKLSYSETNDTLCTLDYRMKYPEINFSKPYYGKGIKPVGKSNEEKIASALNKLLEEDKTLNFVTNAETKQQCIYGIGDIHLDSVVAKLKSRFKIDVALEDIILCFRETIQKSYTKRTKFKKQTGGHGQYGEVEIEFKPTHDYNTSYIFKEKVFGGAVPKAYFPAVEKGLIESVQHGILAGYPVLGIEATLLDGSYHTVDSSEQAFKTATSMCFKEAMAKCDPCILEPFVRLNVYIDDEYLGDIMSHINKKRGRVLESDSLEDGLMKIVCYVPQMEIMEYAIDLRSMTQGQGLYDYTFVGYEIAPDLIAKKIIENKR